MSNSTPCCLHLKMCQLKKTKNLQKNSSAATIEASEVELDPVKAQVEYAKNKNKSN